MSYQTIWRTFDSCNNFQMPGTVPQPEGYVEYWYADAGEKSRSHIAGMIYLCVFIAAGTFLLFMFIDSVYLTKLRFMQQIGE